MADFTKNVPGRYGYLCVRCGLIAFAFTGVRRPFADVLLEDMTISQRGPKPSRRADDIRCQHCGMKAQTHGGYLIHQPDRSLVVDLAAWQAEYQRQKDAYHRRMNQRPLIYDAAYHGIWRTPEEQKQYEKELAETPEEDAPVAAPVGPVTGGAAERFAQNHPVKPGFDHQQVRNFLGE